MGRPKTKVHRNKTIKVCYSPMEVEQLKKDFSKSSCRTLTQYIRDLSLKYPFQIHRNRAFDQFVEEIVELRKEMQEIRRKMVLTKENEKRITELYEEIKDKINKLIDLCMLK